MEPYPKHCLICGAAITMGIDSHVRHTHQMSYEEYCRYFYAAVGGYSIYVDKNNKRVLTITREIRAQ